MKKIKSVIIDIFGYTSTFFTFFVLVEVILKIINKDTYIRVDKIIYEFIICIFMSTICYVIWNSKILYKYSYKIKSVIQYLLFLGLIFVLNDLQDMRKAIIIFIYYNVLYFSLRFIFICKDWRTVEKLNNIIKKLKERYDE